MARNYNLPKQPYQLLSIHRLGIENAGGVCCDNCGAVLANHANIRDKQGKVYVVGLDCLKTLTNDLSNKYEADMEVYSFNKILKFLAAFEKHKPKTFYNDGFELRFSYINEKGKEINESAFVHSFKKFKINLPF